MLVHADQRYITALLENDQQLIRDIYRRFAPTIRSHILNHRGTADDAADILQESLIDIYNQAKHNDLRLTCPFEPFLLLICKRKWLNELKKRGHSPVTKLSDDLSEWGEDSFAAAEDVSREEEKARVFLQQHKEVAREIEEQIRAKLLPVKQPRNGNGAADQGESA